MRRLSVLLAACITLALTTRAAFAVCAFDCPPPIDPPNGPATSTIPQGIRVMGLGPLGVIDPAAEFEVVVRDLANNPVAGAIVVVDFSACAPATVCRITATGCDSLDRPSQRGAAVTGPDGRVLMRFAGCAHNPGGGPTFGDGRARIYACGVLLGTVPVAFVDQNGSDGAGANDLSAWLDDFITAANAPRSDYDFNGSLGANDLSVWLTVAGSGHSALGCADLP